MEKIADRDERVVLPRLSPLLGDVGLDRAPEILALADGIHQRLDFRYPPFRFEDFLRVFDSYRVFEVDLPLGLDGRIVLGPGAQQKTIQVRRENSRPRLRFALAHEIMHAELHFHGKRDDHHMACRAGDGDRDPGRDLVEREADFGAAALLAPLWMIDRSVPYRSSAEYPDPAVARLARTFRVSEAVMRGQLARYAALLRGGPEDGEALRQRLPRGLEWVRPAWRRADPLPASPFPRHPRS